MTRVKSGKEVNLKKKKNPPEVRVGQTSSIAHLFNRLLFSHLERLLLRYSVTLMNAFKGKKPEHILIYPSYGTNIK